MTAITSQKPGPSDFANLSGAYLDRPALILCGGPSLPDQVTAAGDSDWLRISANEHGVKLLGDAVDYIVALDNIPEKVYGIGPQVIGFYLWSDYRLLNFWNAGNSGIQAVWVAHALGCNPIVIAGADCYTNGTYFWDRDAHSSGNASELPSHLQAWQSVMYAGRCTMAAIRAVDGPLTDVFGKYEPRRYERPQPFNLKDEEWGSIVKPGALIEIINSCAIGGEHYEAGQIARMDYHRAREVVTLGKARWSKEQEVDDRERSRPAGVPDDIRPKRDGRGKRSPRAAG